LDERVKHRTQALLAERTKRAFDESEVMVASTLLFGSLRFMNAVARAGYTARELALGDEAVGVLLDPLAQGSGPAGVPRVRMLVVTKLQDFSVPIESKVRAPAHGFVALGADDAMYLVATTPDAASLPPDLRAVLDAGRGPAVNGERTSAGCPGSICFRFSRSDYEGALKLPGVYHPRVLLSSGRSSPANSGKGEGLWVSRSRLDEARRRLGVVPSFGRPLPSP
jgi:hypothetical protein